MQENALLRGTQAQAGVSVPTAYTSTEETVTVSDSLLMSGRCKRVGCKGCDMLVRLFLVFAEQSDDLLSVGDLLR